MRENYLAFLQLPKERRAQTRPPDRKLPDLPGLLAEVAEPFAGNCAFCGVETAREIYRFRPTGDALQTISATRRVTRGRGRKVRPLPPEFASVFVEELGKGEELLNNPLQMYYGWLADAWSNLYPICNGCRPSNERHFPVQGERSYIPTLAEYSSYVSENSGRWTRAISENALLVDPCRNDPEKHMLLRPDGVIDEIDASGRFTIDFFHLNRVELVHKRATISRPPPRAKNAFPKPRNGPKWELSRIRIENFKGIERLDLDFPPRPSDSPARAATLLILGENAAGKSSILEAVALAMITSPARRKLLKKPEIYLLDPRFMGSTELPVRSECRVTLDFVAESRFTQVVGTLTSQGMTVGRKDRSLPKVFAYGAYRQYLEGVRRGGTEQGVVTLFCSDAILSNPRDWLLSLPSERFDEVIAALRYVFGIDFHAVRRIGSDCIVVTQLGGVETKTPLMSVSSGFRTVLALVCDLLRWLIDAPATRDMRLAEMQALILIDEVEVHLHPRWKMAIVDGLRCALPGTTFLMTTHDPLCLRRAAPDEVRVVTRTLAEGKTELPMLVEALDNLPDMGALTVDQLLTADFFGLGDTDDPDSVRAIEVLTSQYATGLADLPHTEVARRLQARLLRDLPIGRTEVERIVQEALNDYLLERRSKRPEWRKQTKDRILSLLRDL